MASLRYSLSNQVVHLETEIAKFQSAGPNAEDSGSPQGAASGRVVELEAEIARLKAAQTTQAPGDGSSELQELQARLEQAEAANEQWSSYANGVAAEKAEVEAEAQQLRGVLEQTVAALTQTQGSLQVHEHQRVLQLIRVGLRWWG